jgi:hypothetical protein
MDYELNVEITEDGEALAKRREVAGCFVLLTNDPERMLLPITPITGPLCS